MTENHAGETPALPGSKRRAPRQAQASSTYWFDASIAQDSSGKGTGRLYKRRFGGHFQCLHFLRMLVRGPSYDDGMVWIASRRRGPYLQSLMRDHGCGDIGSTKQPGGLAGRLTPRFRDIPPDFPKIDFGEVIMARHRKLGIGMRNKSIRSDCLVLAKPPLVHDEASKHFIVSNINQFWLMVAQHAITRLIRSIIVLGMASLNCSVP